MTTIPQDILLRWNGKALWADNAVLENFIEFLDFHDELKHGDTMNAYADAAKANRMSAETFRGKFGSVLRFRECNIRNWFDRGISWDHLAKAPSLSEYRKITPAELIDECINLGNAEGETMTADEMTAHALSGEDSPPPDVYNLIERAFSKLVKFTKMTEWDDEKRGRWETWKEAGEEFFK